MKPADLYRAVHDAGMYLRADGDKLVVGPSERLTAELRQLLREHKSAMLVFLADAHRTLAELLEAAMGVCDQHGDGLAARADMERDCLSMPLHFRADLLDHFRGCHAAPDEPISPDWQEMGESIEGGSALTKTSSPRGAVRSGISPRRSKP